MMPGAAMNALDLNTGKFYNYSGSTLIIPTSSTYNV